MLCVTAVVCLFGVINHLIFNQLKSKVFSRHNKNNKRTHLHHTKPPTTTTQNCSSKNLKQVILLSELSRLVDQFEGEMGEVRVRVDSHPWNTATLTAQQIQGIQKVCLVLVNL